MSSKTPAKPAASRDDRLTPAKPAASRDDRLKAALKANMARRKAQTRARTARHDDADTPDAGEKTEKDKP